MLFSELSKFFGVDIFDFILSSSDFIEFLSSSYPNELIKSNINENI